MSPRNLRRLILMAALVSLPAQAGSAATQKRAAQKATPAVKPRATPTPTPTPAPRPVRKTGSKATAGKAAPRATLPPSRPDRTLFESAQKSEALLRKSARLKSRRTEWEKVASAYIAVVERYPRSPYCDNALLNAGGLEREMSEAFNVRKYQDQALASYSLIVDEYPGSPLGEPALFATYEILTERNQKSGAKDTALKYLAAYPDGKHAKFFAESTAAPKPRAAAKGPEKTSTPAAGSPTGGSQFERTPGGKVQVFGLRFWSGDSSTRVVIDLDKKVEILQSRLQSPPRLFVDLVGTRLHPNLIGKTFPVGNAFLKQIRIGINREDVVRVVIDFAEASGHNVFFLSAPDRLVIDVKGEAGKGSRIASFDSRPPMPPGSTPAPGPASASTPAETMESVEVRQEIPVALEAEPEPETKASPSPGPSPTPTPRLPLPTQKPTPRVEAPPAPTPTARPTPTPPVPIASAAPPRNRDGSYSLARQLGLGARRICLDAGHGGHDPGAIGRGGTQEKDLTLAIVLRLEKLIRTELGADVVMTRDTDVFIPLEERTAIANSSGADLFLSVHINSARNSAGRGLETYYLSFAKSAAAEELAARENAISQATMKDLNNLVRAIATNSKIDESRDFAGIIQKSNVDGLTPDFKGVLDRGVHTAPFYVLIGANMPSILTEVGFISNPDEERWLKSEPYQEQLSRSILEGVRSYLAQVNQAQSGKLGSRSGLRVAARSRSRR